MYDLSTVHLGYCVGRCTSANVTAVTKCSCVSVLLALGKRMSGMLMVKD